jgi:Bacterial protein of unknown function (DUF937)
MAVNLVGMVMQYLTPGRIGRIAAAFNLDSKSTQSAAEVSVPSLLAGLASIALKPTGAPKLVDAVREHAGALDSRSNAVGGSTNQAVLADKGTQWLSSLLGDQNQTALAQAVAKFCGLSQAAGEALLGLFFPVVLGTIAKQLGASSLNASSLTRVLASQKDSIAAALPSGFADLLRGTGLLGALSGAAGTVSAAANQTSMAASTATDGGSRAATVVTDQVSRADTTATRAASDAGTGADSLAAPGSFNWLYWIISALILAALIAWFFASNRPEQVAQPPVKPTTQNLMLAGVDVGKEIAGGLENLRTAFQGITDADSAKAALPKLQDAKGQIDKVNGLIGQLSPEQRKILAGLVNQFTPTLNSLFDKVLTIPGVAELIKPTIDELRTTLAALSAT